MDSITQGILGAAAAQSIMGRRLPRRAGLIGAVAAVLPDLDVFIQSATDPTVGWLFHRHFTHSLFFIPVGGLIAALPFLFLKEFKDYRREVIITAIIGYATHAPLDMLTSYGTQLFWPVSSYRVALDWIGIVDPIFSLMLLTGVVATATTNRFHPARIALILSIMYLFFGAWQHNRAVETQQQIAEIRGHKVEQSRVMPAPGWLLLWRSTYISDGRIYADGIKTPWFNSTLVLEGGSAEAIKLENLPVTARLNPETMRRFRIFFWFTDGWVSPINNDHLSFGDMRITASVESLEPLWGLKIDGKSGEATRWIPGNPLRRDFRALFRDLLLGDPRFKPLISFQFPVSSFQ